MGGADARIHVENNAFGPTPDVNTVNPLAGKSASANRFLSAVSQRVSKRPIWFAEAAHSATALPPAIQRIAGSWRGRLASFTSSYPARRPKTDCRNGLGEARRQTWPSAPAALAREGVGDHLAGRHAAAERIIKLAIAAHSRVRGLDRTAKPNRQSPVEIESQNIVLRFTRLIRNGHLGK